MLTGAENQVLTDAADTLRNYRQLISQFGFFECFNINCNAITVVVKETRSREIIDQLTRS